MSQLTLSPLFELFKRSDNPWESSSSSFSDIGWQFVTGSIIAFILTILLYIFVFPEKRKNMLNAFFTFIRDFFDLKYLIIEKILKFFYVFDTVFVVCAGFFLLFGRTALVGLCLIIFGPFVVRLIYEATMLKIILVKKTIDINNKLEDKGIGENPFSGFPEFRKSANKASFQNSNSYNNQYDNPLNQGQQSFEQQAFNQGQQSYDQQSFNQGQQSYDQQSFSQGQQSYSQQSYDQQSQSSANVCPNCGAPVEDSAAFCAVCGSKVN